MAQGFEVTQLVYVAAKLGIADHLKTEPRSSDELAGLVEAHPGTLYRLMRALSSLGIFHEREDGLFEGTPLSEPLREDAPNSARMWAIMSGEEWMWRPWGNLLHSVRTGETAFNSTFGIGMFEYFCEHIEAGSIFDNIMSISTSGISYELAHSYDFSNTGLIVDVGGGHGLLLAAILSANQGIRAILYDAHQVLNSAQKILEASRISDRCEMVGGNFFESVPSGADTYIMKWIIHDWDDRRAVRILKNCRAAMAIGGKVLVIEHILEPGNQPTREKRSDIMMMVMPGGQERTETQFRSLFEAAGLRLKKVIETSVGLSVMECIAA